MHDDTIHTLGAPELDLVSGGYFGGCLPGPWPPFPSLPPFPWPIPRPVPSPFPPRPRPGPVPIPFWPGPSQQVLPA